MSRAAGGWAHDFIMFFMNFHEFSAVPNPCGFLPDLGLGPSIFKIQRRFSRMGGGGRRKAGLFLFGGSRSVKGAMHDGPRMVRATEGA